MELEVLQFVRIKNKAGWCCIGKLYNINDFREPSMKYCIDIQKDDFIFVPEDMIVKASHNIIDLIEEGDYVNGSKVVDIGIIGKDKEKWVWVEQMEDTDNKYGDDYVGYNNEQIKSIVTKEQFEAMEYRLGDK